jgi:hypothetical protein
MGLLFSNVAPFKRCSVAALEFAPAAARARIVATYAHRWRLQSGFFGEKCLHHLGWSAISTQQFGHDLHWPVHMVEESLVSGAEVVQTRVAVGRLDEPVLRAFAVTRKAHVTLAAIAGQRVALVVPKFSLLFRRAWLAIGCECCRANISVRQSDRRNRDRRCAPAP